MNWNELVQQKRVTAEPSSKNEIDQLQALAARNLADAALPNLSPDGKFSLAYNAARTLATIAIRASGYRVKAMGGAHHNTFLALEAAMGLSVASMAAYFDSCRTKRNELSYDAANVVGACDAEELRKKTETFRRTLTRWLAEHHSSLV